ncbi:MAG TPA: lysozyme inhibitor LprI family protein [Blastocatellia bacterium]|nr:lysozyme inhibitor LprI family protein [Blastocatellia bacterium]
MKTAFLIASLSALTLVSVSALVKDAGKTPDPISQSSRTESGVIPGQTQGEMNDEACGKYKKADAELNRIYNRILREYANDRIFLRKLKAAQRAWVIFRDAHLESIYPDPDPHTYGSVNPMCRCTVLSELTNERVKTLKAWLDGIEEGDVCAGNVRIKRGK